MYNKHFSKNNKKIKNIYIIYMSEKNYPYKSKVVLTEKQATKEPVGSYYHPTEKTFRSGACPVGMTLQKGYHRKGYMKMNGTVINNTNVDPVCVKNKGLPGKLLKKEQHDFKEFGYLTSSNNNSRFKSLLEACKVLSYGTVMRKLSVLKKRYSKKEDNKSTKLHAIYNSDILMLQKWRLKNPDLYKVKSELLLVGGGTCYLYKTKINSKDLRLIVGIMGKLAIGLKKMKEADLLGHLKRNIGEKINGVYIDYETIKFIKKYMNLECLDVSEITDVSDTDNTGLFENFDFKGMKELGYKVDISKWELKSIKNMSRMFEDSIHFNQDLSNWGQYLINVTDMSYMFRNSNGYYEDAFNQNLSSWGPYLTNVENMSGMFQNTKSFKGNGLNDWGPHLGNVKNMSYMFNGCIAFEKKLTWWKYLVNLENMDYMFDNENICIQDFSDIELPKLGPEFIRQHSYAMFGNCKTTTKPISEKFLIKNTLKNKITNKITKIGRMFRQ
jgi:hypothetical protein